MCPSKSDGSINGLPDVSEDTVREVIETLAELERPPCSPGEREAALWIEQRLRKAGCDDVVTEEETAWGSFPPNLAAVGILGTIGAGLVLAGRRRTGALASLISLAGLLDEIENGPRILRRAIRKPKTTVNVVARAGDPSADRTLVVLGHHDAAQTGIIFDQSWAKALHKRAPDLMESGKGLPPQWWLGVAPGLLSLAGAASRRRRPARAAVFLAALGTALIVDILRSPTVPGANDNLSGVAVLVALAEALQARPLSGLRVLLISCGAEESFQEGIRPFMARHRHELIQGRTWFLNYDTVGSPRLVLLEGEGPVWMEDYCDPSFRDLVEGCARDNGIGVIRGIRARASTDGIIPSRAGHPTASFISFMPWGMPGNYHLMSDVPRNLDYEAIVRSARLGYAVARELAGAA
jgi:Peptidase family M28